VAVIAPSILAEVPHDYREQIERVKDYAHRIHIDLTDGVFAPGKTVRLEQVWWPPGVHADLHIMYQKPLEHLETIISLGPQMVIIHAECFQPDQFLHELSGLGIKKGVALQRDTRPVEHEELIKSADHVLLFTGDLGHFGGTADLSQLEKINSIKSINPNAEIGWDGGVNDVNADEIVAGGVNVLVVGGFIQKAHDPEAAYDKIKAVVG
jgi:ribulose-phosphate 3-epimerase